MATLSATVWRLRQQTAGLPRGSYSVYGAWLRGLIYLCGSAILALLTGIFGRLIGQPLASSANLADPAWMALTGLCIAVELVAYFVICGQILRKVRAVPSMTAASSRDLSTDYPDSR